MTKMSQIGHFALKMDRISVHVSAFKIDILASFLKRSSKKAPFHNFGIWPQLEFDPNADKKKLFSAFFLKKKQK